MSPSLGWLGLPATHRQLPWRSESELQRCQLACDHNSVPRDENRFERQSVEHSLAPDRRLSARYPLECSLPQAASRSARDCEVYSDIAVSNCAKLLLDSRCWPAVSGFPLQFLQ